MKEMSLYQARSILHALWKKIINFRFFIIAHWLESIKQLKYKTTIFYQGPLLPTHIRDLSKEIETFGVHLILELLIGINVYFATNTRFLRINENWMGGSSCAFRFICMSHADIIWWKITIRITSPVVSLIHQWGGVVQNTIRAYFWYISTIINVGILTHFEFNKVLFIFIPHIQSLDSF